MRNIEIKVRVLDLGGIREHAIWLGASHQWTHQQADTYFNVRRGRLKLRETSADEHATLISYSRPDESDSRISHYRLLPVSDAETLRQMLDETLGVQITIRKRRELLLYGATRIHLDEVEELGTFVELETVIDEQSPDQAWQEHQQVRNGLGLDSHQRVPVSYSDLMLAR